MFQAHPNLSAEINNAIADSELQGGVFLKDVPVGKKLIVQTRNTTYTIEVCEDGTYIYGNAKYCPAPIKCFISGSTWGGSMLKVGFIGRGMCLEFVVDVQGVRKIGEVDGHGRITTSQIQEITEL